MGEKITNNLAESKTVSRYIPDNYYSVQFSLNDMGPIYLFKLRDISLNAPCILIMDLRQKSSDKTSCLELNTISTPFLFRSLSR